MKHRIRFAALLMALASLLLLTGCTLGSSVESLFVLPQLPEEYRELSAALDSLLEEGYTYVTPTAGPNVESVQMVDLDGDNTKEAVALMQRMGEPDPLRVMVFKQSDNGFERLCATEHAGTGIDSINYYDITGDGRAELVVGWREENDAQTLCVYCVGQETLPLLESDYGEYLMKDLAGSGKPGLLILREDVHFGTVAEYYTWQTDILRLTQSCTINSGMSEISRGSMVGGSIAGGIPAVFLTCVDSSNTVTTDVLICSAESGLIHVVSDYLPRPYCQLDPQDVNGDGVTEIPCPIKNAGGDQSSTIKDTLVSWMRCDADGNLVKVSETYHCRSYGWYVTLPEEHWDRVTVMNGDIISGENCVEFSLEGKPVAALYSITCENRESRAQMGDRFIVTRLPGTIYAGEIYDAAADGAAVTALRNSFSMIVSTWDSAGKE